MKGLLKFKPIQESIIFHATPNEFGQFLLVSRNIIKFQNVIDKMNINIKVVKQNGWNLQFLSYQTDRICIEAVKQYGWALKQVENQTDQICLEAVRQTGTALQFVKQQTDQICIEAVKQDGFALQFVNHQTDQICLEAVKQYPDVKKYIKSKNPRNPK